MHISGYSEEGVWIQIPYYEIMSEGAEETYEKLIQFTTGLSLINQYDDDEEFCKYALFQ